MANTKGGLYTERLRAALIAEAALAGITPVQLVKQLTTEPPQKTISFRPSAELRAAIDQEAERTQTSAGQVCKAWLEKRVSPPKEETLQIVNQHLAAKEAESTEAPSSE